MKDPLASQSDKILERLVHQARVELGYEEIEEVDLGLPPNILRDISEMSRRKAKRNQRKRQRQMEKRNGMHYVFVYGTLKEGHPNHDAYLADAIKCGNAVTMSFRYDLKDIGNLPMVVRKGQCGIIGELYLVDQATLDRLDVLEGHPDFYTREMIPVLLETDMSNNILANVYFGKEYEASIQNSSRVSYYEQVVADNVYKFKEWLPKPADH